MSEEPQDVPYLVACRSCHAPGAVYDEISGPSPSLRLEPAAGIEPLRADWTALAEASGNVFSTWEWAAAWWRHYGEGRRQLPIACRDAAGRIAAILPLCLDRTRPLRVARFIGHGAADELGPVCAPGDARAAAGALAAAHAAAPERWSVLVADRLLGDGPCPPGAGEVRREQSPVIDIAGLTWDEYLASRSSNFRSQVRRKERKLRREHGLGYRLCDDPVRLPGDMETLFALHRARWGEDGSHALDGRRAAFHRDFAAVALERGWLRLWIAEVDGDPVAAWYGFRFGGAEWYYQFGRDPAWDHFSVGLVLLAHTLREAVGDRLECYRLLRGGESYKERFASRDPGIVTVALPRGALGRAAVAGARGALRLPPPLRQRVARFAS